MHRAPLREIMYGVAIGDAWGRLTERKDYANIVAEYGTRGPELSNAEMGGTLYVTDDTQMSLYLAQAIRGHTSLTDALRDDVTRAWVTWLDDEDNYRAPDQACITAARRLKDGMHWTKSTQRDNDGSGAVMRAWACAYMDDPAEGDAAAAWQAASTHGGANAILASMFLTRIVRSGFSVDSALGTLDDLCRRAYVQDAVLDGLIGLRGMSQRDDIRAYVLNSLGDDTDPNTVRGAVARARHMYDRLASDPWNGDIELQGWRSHETLAAAALCVDLFAWDPVSAIRRAVTTDGDSDTVGAVVGGLCAVRHPLPWTDMPEDWLAKLEPRYRAEIDAL